MESLTENRSLLYRFYLCFSLSGFSPQISLVLSFQSPLHSLAGAGGFVVMLALGWLPEFSDQFSIVDFSDEFRSILLQVRVFATFLGFNICPFQVRFYLFLVFNLCLFQVLAVDAAAAYILDRALMFLFGEGRFNIKR